MQFIYGEFAGEQEVEVSIKEYAHIFKVRRVDKNKPLFWRNLRDDYLYEYAIKSIDKKSSTLILKDKKRFDKKTKSSLTVGWCVVDPKVIEKQISMLNEMGVKRVVFVYADFSQNNFKIDLKRLNRILINSCEQCGRSDLMEIETLMSVKEFLDKYPKSIVIDFVDTLLGDSFVESFLVGPEGGFSKSERELFKKEQVFRLKSENILKSQTAVVGVCAKILL